MNKSTLTSRVFQKQPSAHARDSITKSNISTIIITETQKVLVFLQF